MYKYFPYKEMKEECIICVCQKEFLWGKVEFITS